MKNVRLFVAVCLTIVMFVSIAYAANEFCVNGKKTTLEEQAASMDDQGIVTIVYTTTVIIDEDATCMPVEFPSTCTTTNVARVTLTFRVVIRNPAGIIVYDSTDIASSEDTMKICG
ncbi:MAG: hypothetical protein LBF88_02235 [Planctomycetaceae bacterium]|jgi:hypothetical protein|nr:hypothetical protein [Planctomycetaceae bacterium]